MEDGAHRDSPGLGLAALSHDQTGKERGGLMEPGLVRPAYEKSPGKERRFPGLVRIGRAKRAYLSRIDRSRTAPRSALVAKAA